MERFSEVWQNECPAHFLHSLLLTPSPTPSSSPSPPSLVKMVYGTVLQWRLPYEVIKRIQMIPASIRLKRIGESIVATSMLGQICFSTHPGQFDPNRLSSSAPNFERLTKFEKKGSLARWRCRYWGSPSPRGGGAVKRHGRWPREQGTLMPWSSRALWEWARRGDPTLGSMMTNNLVTRRQVI